MATTREHRDRIARANPTRRELNSGRPLEGQLLKARDLGLLTVTEADDLLRLGDRVSKLSVGLSRSSKPS